jgi:hypothetical protein
MIRLHGSSFKVDEFILLAIKNESFLNIMVRDDPVPEGSSELCSATTALGLGRKA